MTPDSLKLISSYIEFHSAVGRSDKARVSSGSGGVCLVKARGTVGLHVRGCKWGVACGCP